MANKGATYIMLVSLYTELMKQMRGLQVLGCSNVRQGEFAESAEIHLLHHSPGVAYLDRSLPVALLALQERSSHVHNTQHHLTAILSLKAKIEIGHPLAPAHCPLRVAAPPSLLSGSVKSFVR